MDFIKNPKTIAIGATLLCIASLLWLMSTQRVNNSLETNLEHEKLKSEALLSEKLLLEKDLEKIRGQLSTLTGINSELDKVVKNAEARVMNQESELKRLKKQNASMAQIQKQREELLRLQTDLENELLALRASHADLERQNSSLSGLVAELQAQNRLLKDDLSRAMLAAVDQAQLQAVKGKKERLTVKARRTNKLIANFEVPASLKNISFRVLDSNGKPLPNDRGTIVSRSTDSDQNVLASTEGGALNGLKKVEMEYIPKAKLASGLYTVEILNDNLYVGSLKVKLR